MITYAIESFEEILDELKVILPVHYEELSLHKDAGFELDPQYEEYIRRERLGAMVFVTMRELGELVGYFIGFIAPGLHYKTCLTCHLDIFYLRKDKRGGWDGTKLFRFTEKELKRRGVNYWVVSSKVKQDASSLFEFLKFEPVEKIYGKWI